MTVAIRTDESQEIGTGHLVRCQTLADALHARGVDVTFVCRHLSVHAEQRLRSAGHAVLRIAGGGDPDELHYSRWLEGSQATDAAMAEAALSGRMLDWLIVDHYALDHRWETRMRGKAGRVMVVDDLADRVHECDLLLDHNLHPKPTGRYERLVPAHAKSLLGPRYALLRPEFAALPRRAHIGQVRRVLVFFGGVDTANQTGRTLSLLPAVLPEGTEVDVVIGILHPFREEILATCERAGYNCHVQTHRMAELMHSADFAIGGGGTATWERCCAGLPALVWAQAENQREQVVEAAHAGFLHALSDLTLDDAELTREIALLLEDISRLRLMSKVGTSLVDGRGAARVCNELGYATVMTGQVSRLTSEDPGFDGPLSGNLSQDASSSHDDRGRRLSARQVGYVVEGLRNGTRVGMGTVMLESEPASRVFLEMVSAATPDLIIEDFAVALERWLDCNAPEHADKISFHPVTPRKPPEIYSDVIGDNLGAG